MNRIIKIFVFVFFVDLIIFSCGKAYTYEWTYIIAKNMDKDLEVNSDSISNDNYGIRVHFFDRKYAYNNYSFFINKTYATTKPHNSRKTDIVNINIKTLNKLNNEYGEFSIVNNLFEYYINNEFGTYKCDSIGECINVLNNVYDKTESFDLKLNYNQITDTIHQFIIQIELSDNKILTSTTAPLRIY